MATTLFERVVLNLKESSYPSCLSDCTVMKESPLKENVVCISHVSPSNPSVQEQLALWSDSPTSQGVQVPPLRQFTVWQPVSSTEQFLPPNSFPHWHS